MLWHINDRYRHLHDRPVTVHTGAGHDRGRYGIADPLPLPWEPPSAPAHRPRTLPTLRPISRGGPTFTPETTGEAFAPYRSPARGLRTRHWEQSTHDAIAESLDGLIRHVARVNWTSTREGKDGETIVLHFTRDYYRDLNIPLPNPDIHIGPAFNWVRKYPNYLPGPTPIPAGISILYGKPGQRTVTVQRPTLKDIPKTGRGNGRNRLVQSYRVA